MAETFDLVFKGGTLVNHAGEGLADIGIRHGRIAAIGDIAEGLARRDLRCGRTAYPAGRHRHPGPFPRARPGVEGRPRDRQSRGGAGRRHRRLRDAQHRAAHHERRRAGRQARPRARTACTATTPSTSAAPTRTPRSAELERLPGCCGIKVFMGASTGNLLVQTTRGFEHVLATINRRAAFHSEDESRLEERLPAARHRRPDQPPRGATPSRRDLHRAAGAARRARSASASTCCTSPPPRRSRSSPRTRTSPASRSRRST